MSLTIATSYRDDVAKVFAGKLIQPVLNSTLDHACIVVEEAFKAARTDVRVLASDMDAELFSAPSVQDAMITFLSRDTSHLDILVDEKSRPVAMEFARDLADAGPGKLSIAIVPSDVAATYPHDFLVVDDSGYRYAPDRGQHVAVVAGGESYRPATNRLINAFTALKASSQPLDA